MTRRSLSTRDRLRIFTVHSGESARFESKVSPEPNSGCWLWHGAATARGYGHMLFRGRYEKAHRVSYLLHRGEIPTGSVVCHACDVTACVNPDHLWIGRPLDNVRDCIAKGRARRGRLSGEDASQAKLTARQVEDIRSRPRPYGYRVQLSREFGVSASAISKIVGGETWQP